MTEKEPQKQHDTGGLRSSIKSFISGGVGGMSLVAAGQPFDLIKVRLQTSNDYKNAVDCARKIIAKDGIRGLYRGMAAPLTGVTPIFATCFWGYDVGKQLSRWACGQSADEKLSLNQIMFAGGFSAIPTTALMAPGERIKVVVQTNSSLKGPIDAIKFIRREQGIGGLFKGTAATLARDIPGSVAYFGAYEVLKNALTSKDGSISPLAILFAGGMAGVANWTVAIPADVIKSRIQSTTGSISMARVVSDLYREEGIKGFFRGLGPVMLRAFPANAACFLGVEMSRKLLDRFI